MERGARGEQHTRSCWLSVGARASVFFFCGGFCSFAASLSPCWWSTSSFPLRSFAATGGASLVLIVCAMLPPRVCALPRAGLPRPQGDAPLEGKERWVSVFRSWGKGVQKTSKKAGVLQVFAAKMRSWTWM